VKTGVQILITFLVLIALLAGLEKAYDFGLKHNRNLKIVAAGSPESKSSLVVHGPCEPLWMISPAQIDSITGETSYNLALSHSDFADNYLHLYEYLRHHPAPTLMLLYVTPESMDIHFNAFHAYRFAPYLSDPEVRAVVKENDPAYFRWTWVPFIKYAYYNRKVMFNVIQGYKHYLTGRSEAYYPDGFEPPAKRFWGNHAGEFVMLYKDSVQFQWDGLRAKYLAKTVRLAKQHGTKVILYESPVLAESLPFQPNRKGILHRLDSLAAAEGVQYVRFEGLEMAKHRRYFISTLNFNMNGLRLFNDTLAKFLLRCGYRSAGTYE
jgi:hypothetical protein